MPNHILELRELTVAPAESNVKSPLKESPSQTAGPYVHIGCLPNFIGNEGVFEQDLTENKSLPDGKKITIKGVIYDGDGQISKDFMVESWQADQTGDLTNGIWRRAPTNLTSGEFVIETILPGRVSNQALHIDLWIVARGINLGLHTKIYFDDQDNSSDPILALVPEQRTASLIAEKQGEHYKFDIHLQGEKETVFFDV